MIFLTEWYLLLDFLKPDGKLSWLWWPKAKDVQVEENAFTVLQNGVPKLKYIYAG